MSLTKQGYNPRLIDEEIERNLKLFGAISIEGPKWCGKTWTALNHCNSVTYLNNTADNFRAYDKRPLDLGIGNEVDVSLSVSRVRIFQSVELFGQRSKRL